MIGGQPPTQTIPAVSLVKVCTQRGASKTPKILHTKGQNTLVNWLIDESLLLFILFVCDLLHIWPDSVRGQHLVTDDFLEFRNSFHCLSRFCLVRIFVQISVCIVASKLTLATNCLFYSICLTMTWWLVSVLFFPHHHESSIISCLAWLCCFRRSRCIFRTKGFCVITKDGCWLLSLDSQVAKAKRRNGLG